MLHPMTFPSRLHPRKTRSVMRFDFTHLAPEAQLLVLLARTSINGTFQVEIQDRLRDRVDWHRMWQHARANGVASLVYRTLASHGRGAVPKDMLEGFQRHAQATAILCRLLADELLALVGALTAKGIRAVPFGGPTLALAAYGDLALRESTSLDLILEHTSIPQAHQLLWSRGYQLVRQLAVDGNEKDDASSCFVKKNGMFRVVLRSVAAGRLFPSCLDREQSWNDLKPVRLGQSTILALGHEELLLTLCVHGLQHAWGDLRSVCDVAELIRRRRAMDWSRLLYLSRQRRCRRILLLGLATAHSLFDVPLPRAVQDAVTADSDVQDLAKRMPARLLRKEQEGVEEADVEALCLTLKDSWVEHWKYGLILSCAGGPAVTRSPRWFRFQARLNMLCYLLHPVHRAMAWCAHFLKVKKVRVKWLEIPG